MKKIFIMQTKSKIGRLPKHKAILNGLGLKRIRDVVIREDTPSIRGMLKKIEYMVKIQEEDFKCI